jgi:hypothetical protein
LHDGAKFEIEDVQVSTTRLNHPHVATAYAITADGARVAYIADTAPFSDILFGQEFLSGPPMPRTKLSKTDKTKLNAMAASVVRLCEGADLVIYDTMYTAEEYRQFPTTGTRDRRTPSSCVRMPGPRCWRFFITPPTARTPRSTPCLKALCAQSETHAPKWKIVAAFEGLDILLGKA